MKKSLCNVLLKTIEPNKNYLCVEMLTLPRSLAILHKGSSLLTYLKYFCLISSFLSEENSNLKFSWSFQCFKKYKLAVWAVQCCHSVLREKDEQMFKIAPMSGYARFLENLRKPRFKFMFSFHSELTTVSFVMFGVFLD